MQTHVQLDTGLHDLVEVARQFIVLGHAFRRVQQPAQLALGLEASPVELPVKVAGRCYGHGLAQQHVRLRVAAGHLVDKRLVKQHQAIAAGSLHHRLQQLQ